MKKIILLLLLGTALFGSKILSYNVYDRHDRVDIMLTFDTPYEGVLRQNQQENIITIKLEEASIDAPINKNIHSAYLENITITPTDEQLQITAKVKNGVILQASKTSDSYGLRLRFSPPASVSELSSQENPDRLALPTKNASEFERSYYVVIGILVVGIIILFWLKRSIAQKTTAMQSQPVTPWLSSFTSKKRPLTNTTIPVGNIESGGVQIRFQKTLDAAHSVAMLDFGTQSYLVLLGNNTILLDKFQDNIPVNQNDFETLLQSKHRELDGFFQIGHVEDEVFDAYKEKASGSY
ncbi:MAG TPA: hypothetical protein VFX68_07740 [Sulfuricurvum sp.]|nr:hypothetical protein [Sulfuricurvum sp.]